MPLHRQAFLTPQGSTGGGGECPLGSKCGGAPEFGSEGVGKAIVYATNF